MAPLIEDALDTGSSSSVAYRPSATNGAAVNGAANGTNGVHGTNGVIGTNGYHANNLAAIPSASSVNGHKPKKHNEHSPYLKPTDVDDEHDIICVGFGPASLAVAAAMHDALAAGRKLRADGNPPKMLFLEKQATFAWHAGMLLQGAKMQISFVKDLATLRDPRSEFTFLNYLHRQGRLVDFTNLSTFLPARSEYEDYLRWAASFFDDVVRYNNEVVAVTPDAAVKSGSSVKTFTVQARNVQSGQTQTFRGRHVVIATGGQPSLPKSFPQKHPRVLHSSQYASALPKLLPNQSAPYRVAVLGGGQSAAEIFKNVQTLYPNSQTRLIMRQEFLRPSDDSPFVNCVFNPEYIDDFSNRSAVHRSQLLTDARATNYGVVRLELIEELYETMYDQRREIGTDEKQWPHRILAGRQIKSIEPRSDDSLELKVQSLEDVLAEGFQDEEEIFQADLVIAATGYQRTAHVDILRGAWDLLPKAAPTKGAELRKGIAGWNVETEQGERKLAVGRDYKVRFAPGSVADDSGVWLQGCCEGTHGLSDTLLSVLGTRSGELVDAIFGKQQ